MFKQILDAMTGKAAATARAADSLEGRIVRIDGDYVIYAIGDVHGRLDLLEALEEKIADDAGATAAIVHVAQLGDIVDRGPSSAQIIDRALAGAGRLPLRLWLMGNHEEMMLAFLEGRGGGRNWLEQGGRETLLSYGISEAALASGLTGREGRSILDAYVPLEHRVFLAERPAMVLTDRYVLSHAGINPARRLEEQRLSDVIWYRDGLAERYERFERTVVHGHQVSEPALVSERRIDIDTGAYFSGRLTAVRLSPTDPPRLLEVTTRRAG